MTKFLAARIGHPLLGTMALMLLLLVAIDPVAGQTVSLNYFQLNTDRIAGGNPVTGQLWLSGPAPSGYAVSLSSSNASAVPVPSSVTVPQGQSYFEFPITTTSVASQATVTVTAKRGSDSFPASITVDPASISGIKFQPDALVGGGNATGTVIMTGPVVTSKTVTLSSDTSLVRVPSSVTVAAGQRQATFTATTSLPSALTLALVRGAVAGRQADGTLTLLSTPADPPRAPVMLTATPKDGAVDLAWLSPDPNASSFKVKQAATSGGPYTIVTTQTQTTKTISGLTNGTKYYFVVSAIGLSGQSSDSPEVSTIPYKSGEIDPSGPLPVIPGEYPLGGLRGAPNGWAYGTASRGGTNRNGFLFRFPLPTVSNGGIIGRKDAEIIHLFSPIDDLLRNSDGALPSTNLLFVSGDAVYGVTRIGGSSGTGTIFRQDPAVTTQAGFSSIPFAGNSSELIRGSNGYLYGTTSDGGDFKNGSIFRLNLAGFVETVYSFPTFATFDTNSTGAFPIGSLCVAADGYLYGTTSAGGGNGTGTIFRWTGQVIEVLHHFGPLDLSGNNSDGFGTSCTLTTVDGVTLYGIASDGGPNGTGTIFKCTTSGQFSVLYSFAAEGVPANPSANSGGTHPLGSLTPAFSPTAQNPVAGKGWLFRAVSPSAYPLYGTASSGGQYGYGTIFSIDDTGAFRVAYEFNNSDGANPITGINQILIPAELQDKAGGIAPVLNWGYYYQVPNVRFYGVTSAGGLYGRGTVFFWDHLAGRFWSVYQFSGK